MSHLALETLPREDGVCLSLEGELDLSSALTFDEQMRRVEETRPSVLVLDLRRLRFMDSTGLRLILNAHARATRAGRRLAILQGPDAVKRIFRLTGVAERLEIFEDRAALEAGR